MRNGAGVRPKIVVATPWPVWPLIDGRRTKAFARCVGWAHVADVEIVSAGASATDEGTARLGAGIVERRVPFCADYGRIERTPFTLAAERSAFFPMHAQANPRFETVLAESLASAALAVACTPFVYRSVRGASAQRVVLDVQAAEISALTDVYADDPVGGEARELTKAIEREAWVGADAVVAPAAFDRSVIVEAGRDPDTIFAVDGTLFRSTDVFVSRDERLARKSRSNFAGAPLVLYAGSATRGNRRSLETMTRLARRLPHVRFLALGSIVDAAAGMAIPTNLGFTGFVDDSQFTAALSFADLCIEMGSVSALGSSKIESYIRCGAPLVADEAIAMRAGVPAGGYRAATERSILDVVIEALTAPDEPSRGAEHAFRQRYEAARARADAAILQAVL